MGSIMAGSDVEERDGRTRHYISTNGSSELEEMATNLPCHFFGLSLFPSMLEHNLESRARSAAY